MSKKSRERRKALGEVEGKSSTRPVKTPEALLRRRNRRFLVIGILAISFPILEVIAYQFRAITITMTNRSDLMVKRIKITYSGGDLAIDELKPGASMTRLIRPDFSFRRDQFSTYAMAIRFAAENGEIFSQLGRAGTLDYSAQETYIVARTPAEGRVQLQHNTRPGFPLNLVRDLMERLGFG